MTDTAVGATCWRADQITRTIDDYYGARGGTSAACALSILKILDVHPERDVDDAPFLLRLATYLAETKGTDWPALEIQSRLRMISARLAISPEAR